jgi:hypothetical protein
VIWCDLVWFGYHCLVISYDSYGSYGSYGFCDSYNNILSLPTSTYLVHVTCTSPLSITKALPPYPPLTSCPRCQHLWPHHYHSPPVPLPLRTYTTHCSTLYPSIMSIIPHSITVYPFMQRYISQIPLFSYIRIVNCVHEATYTKYTYTHSHTFRHMHSHIHSFTHTYPNHLPTNPTSLII